MTNLRIEKVPKTITDLVLQKFFWISVASIAVLLLLDIGFVQDSILWGRGTQVGLHQSALVESNSTLVAQTPKKKRKIGYVRLHGLPNNGEDIVRIFYKVSYCTDLTTVLPNTTDLFTIGYPLHFTADLADYLYGNTAGFDLIALHARWREEEYKKLLGDGAFFVTMMRNPVDAFFDIYTDYYGAMEKFYGDSINMLAGKIGLGIFPNSKRYKGIFGRNQMAWNLGLEESEFDDDEKVNELIRKLEKSFNLSMIYEYYNESLVLLQKTMNLDIRLLAISSSENPPPIREVTLTMGERSALENWLAADMKIYNRFKRKFELLMENLGAEEIFKTHKALEDLNTCNWKTCYDPKNENVVSADNFIEEKEWAVPFRDTSYCRVHGLTEQSMHQDLLYIQMNKDFRNIYKDPTVIFSHFHDEGL